jgi:hypothetical protein
MLPCRHADLLFGRVYRYCIGREGGREIKRVRRVWRVFMLSSNGERELPTHQQSALVTDRTDPSVGTLGKQVDDGHTEESMRSRAYSCVPGMERASFLS